MMLTIGVCLILNCFLFEKFYLHYAQCNFDSIFLHCAKLFIRQSIDHEQIFDVTFQNPPIEKSCVRHCMVETRMFGFQNVFAHAVFVFQNVFSKRKATKGVKRLY